MLPDLGQLSASDKDTLIVELWTRLQAALARAEALEARLGKPPKTPDNSSLPPSKGGKPNKRRRRRKQRKGAPRQGAQAVSAAGPDGDAGGGQVPALRGGAGR